MREYDAKKNDVEAIKKCIESNLHGNENYTTEIKNIFDNWYSRVVQVVMTINHNFGDFMQSMGYVGEVKLVRKEEVWFDVTIFHQLGFDNCLIILCLFYLVRF